MKEQQGLGEDFVEFVRQNLYLVWTGIIVGLLSYGYEMVNFALTIDEEANWNKDVITALTGRIRDGRFSWGLFSPFLSRMFLPFWSTAIFLIFIIVSGLLLSYLYKDFFVKKMSKAAVIALFISMPIHAFYVMFSIMSAETALGYLLTIVAMCLTGKNIKDSKGSSWKLILPASLLAFSCGIYQALIMVYVTMACGNIIVRTIMVSREGFNAEKYKSLWCEICTYIGVFVGGGILYIGIQKLLQFLVADSRGYIESFIIWGSQPIIETIKQFIRDMLKIVFSATSHKAYNTMIIFFIMAMGIFVWGLIKMKSWYRFVWIIGMIGLVSSNFFMSLFTGEILPERTFLTFPIFTALIFAICLELVNIKVMFQGLVVLLLIVVLRQTEITTDLFWAENRRVQADEVKATELINEIANLGYGYEPEIPVAIVSDIVYSPYNGTFGFSYFDLGDRIYGYLSYYGFNYIKPDKEQKQIAVEEAEDMPAFPAKGSVKVIQDIIVVNLKEN